MKNRAEVHVLTKPHNVVCPPFIIEEIATAVRGICGMAAMDLARGNLAAKKACFFFGSITADRLMLALIRILSFPTWQKIRSCNANKHSWVEMISKSENIQAVYTKYPKLIEAAQPASLVTPLGRIEADHSLSTDGLGR